MRSARKRHPGVAALYLWLCGALAACGGQDTTAGPQPAAFAGTYSGIIRATTSVTGEPTPGAVLMTVDANGKATAQVFDVNLSGLWNMSGSVDGTGRATLSAPGTAAQLVGTIVNGAIANGLWSNSGTATAGPWYAEAAWVSPTRLYSSGVGPAYRLRDPLALAAIAIDLSSSAPGWQDLVLSRVHTDSIVRHSTRITPPVALGDYITGNGFFVLYGDGSTCNEKLLYFSPDPANSRNVIAHVRSLPKGSFIVPSAALALGIRAQEIFAAAGAETPAFHAAVDPVSVMRGGC